MPLAKEKILQAPRPAKPAVLCAVRMNTNIQKLVEMRNRSRRKEKRAVKPETLQWREVCVAATAAALPLLCCMLRATYCHPIESPDILLREKQPRVNSSHRLVDIFRDTELLLICRRKMEESLRSWLKSTYKEVADDYDDTIEEDSESGMILILGQYVFSLPDDSSFQDVVEEISAHFGRDLTPFIQSSSTFLIEACLICAVSSLSADRTKFVQIIMKMEPAAKAFIMESLKNNLLHYFDPEQSVNETGHGTTLVSDPNALSDRYQSSTDDLEVPVVNGNPAGTSEVDKEGSSHDDKRLVSICLSCNDNARRRAALKEDVESILKREKEGEIKLRAEITSQTNKLIDAEILIIDMDAKLACKSSQLDTALSAIQENEAKMRGFNKVIGQYQLIQDEIDVLKPKADRAEASELQLEKLRNKLDELKGKSHNLNPCGLLFIQLLSNAYCQLLKMILFRTNDIVCHVSL